MNLISLLLLELQIRLLPLLLKTLHWLPSACRTTVKGLHMIHRPFLMRAHPHHLHETHDTPQSITVQSHFSSVCFQYASFCVWAYCLAWTFWEAHAHPSMPDSSTFLVKLFLMTSSPCGGFFLWIPTVLCTHLHYSTCYPAWTLLVFKPKSSMRLSLLTVILNT